MAASRAGILGGLAVFFSIWCTGFYFEWTGLCFEELRYVSSEEVCKTYLASFRPDQLKPGAECAIGKPSWAGRWSVTTYDLATHLYPNTQWGDVMTGYDECGRPLRRPH